MLAPLPAHLDPGTVVAHRGNRVAERENTVAAFESAGAAGAAGVELDVRRTADGELVVHHDAVVDGVGAIVEHRYEDLASVAPFIPTLDEALTACRDMWVNVEIKNSPDDPDWDEERLVARWLADRFDATGLIVSSFDPISLEVARSNGFPTGLLVIGALLTAVERATAEGHLSVNPQSLLLEGAMAGEAAAAAADAGIWIMTWTVNDEAEAVRLRDSGITAIITDDPAAIGAVLA